MLCRFLAKGSWHRKESIMSEILIVTRHNAAVEWLKRQGITGKVIAQATPSDVTGKDVIGVLPYWLGCLANSVTEVSMPNLTLEQRQKNAQGDMTPDEMDHAGATLVKYSVRKE